MGRNGEQAAERLRLVFLVGARAATSGGGVGGGAGAVPLMDGLVVALTGRQQVVENPEPVVGKGAQGGEVGLAGPAMLVVEGAGPGRASERAEGPAQQGVVQEEVAGLASDHHA